MATTFSDKIRIRLKAYDYRVLDQSTTEIVDTAKRTGARLAGPVPLPTEKNKWTVLPARTSHKKSREQFEDSDASPAEIDTTSSRRRRRWTPLMNWTAGRVDVESQGVREGTQIMVTGILGRKLGMTQIFLPDGTAGPPRSSRRPLRRRARRRRPRRMATKRAIGARGRPNALRRQTRPSPRHFRRPAFRNAHSPRIVACQGDGRGTKAGIRLSRGHVKGASAWTSSPTPWQGIPGRHEAPRVAARTRRTTVRCSIARTGFHRASSIPRASIKGMRMGGGGRQSASRR